MQAFDKRLLLFVTMIVLFGPFNSAHAFFKGGGGGEEPDLFMSCLSKCNKLTPESKAIACRLRCSRLFGDGMVIIDYRPTNLRCEDENQVRRHLRTEWGSATDSRQREIRQELQMLDSDLPCANGIGAPTFNPTGTTI